MARYKIFDGVETIYTPSGAVFTALEWIEKFPIYKTGKKLVIGGDDMDYNGSICFVLNSFVKNYEQMGVDFSGCVTDQDKLDLIEAFEDNPEPVEEEVDPMESIAYALQDLVVLRMIETEE